jgi:hypothetical protein
MPFKRILHAATLAILLTSIAGLAEVTSLANVRKVYVEPMENHLDQYLTSEISRQFHGSLQIVTSAAEADAILRGINLGAQSTNKATVNLVDPLEKLCFGLVLEAIARTSSSTSNTEAFRQSQHT